VTIALWDESMSVGVASIDRDHQILLGLINEIGESRNDPDGEHMVGRYIALLVQYVEFHLSREEKMLEAVGYPGLEDHRAAHGILRDRSARFLRQYQADLEALNLEELELFLCDWWRHHILEEDMAYRPFVIGNGAAEAAANSIRFEAPDGDL